MEPVEKRSTKEKPNKAFRIQPRDLKILDHLARNRFATGAEIQEMFWGGSKRSLAHNRRLKILKVEGLIETVRGDLNTSLGHRITSDGLRYLKDRGADATHFCHARTIYKTTFEHDRLLNVLRRILEASPLVSAFLPEFEVRKELARKHGYYRKADEDYKVPDAWFTLKTANSKNLKVALELELSSKSQARYRKIFRQIANSEDAQIAFFVVKTKTMKASFENMLKDFRQNDPLVRLGRAKVGIYFCLLENLLENRLDAVFEGEESAFSLASLEAKLTGNTKQTPTSPLLPLVKPE